MRIIIAGMLSLLICTTADAKKVGDVEVAETMPIEGSGALLLNGAGMRTKMFFDIYAAGLYLPQKQADAKDVLALNSPVRVSMHFVYSEVSKAKMDAAWQEGVQDNLTSPLSPDLHARLDGFKGLFGDMHKGDLVLLDFIPGQGVSVAINGQLKGKVAGDDLSRALLGVWLGEKPISDSLKEALLGK